jgi:SOS-response transcriptional repressor LexA
MAVNRPSKKQHELLSFIEGFIKGNGYGPSYREIMRALDYKSVSTVAIHVDGLVAKGKLRKKDNSARSLEIVPEISNNNPDDQHFKWLKRHIKQREIVDTEKAKKEVATLSAALTILLDQTES